MDVKNVYTRKRRLKLAPPFLRKEKENKIKRERGLQRSGVTYDRTPLFDRYDPGLIKENPEAARRNV